MNKEEMIFDINEDIIMQIEMNSYMEYNDRIARMNDYIGEIYSYKDIEDMEALQEHHEKELAYKAIRQLQKENKQLKDRIKELEELNEQHKRINGELRQENKQLKEENERLIHTYKGLIKRQYELGNDEFARYLQAQIGDCNTFSPQKY